VEFRVSKVHNISWNDKIFNNLELPQDTKEMILAMVKTQTSGNLKFDDFVLGKGMGLIFNLHGACFRSRFIQLVSLTMF
jgi:hypothetical protein